MTLAELTKRVEALERKMKSVEAKREMDADKRPWWRELRGIYKDDPIMKEIFDLGRQYRESLRPKPRSKRSRKTR
jgi:hypothetical protein